MLDPAAPFGPIQQVLELLDALPEPAPPIKLTRPQLDQLRAAVPASSATAAAGLLTAVPIVLVDSTTESTPYTEGWIKCPSCGAPANDHRRVVCDKVLVFGPFGDFAVRRPPRDVGWREQQLLSAPGFTYGDLSRIKADLLAMAVAVDIDEDLANAVARWEDDGGA